MQFRFDRIEQVARLLFIDVKFAVAGDAKMPVTQDGCAREQIGQVIADEPAKPDIVPPLVRPRQLHQTRLVARNLDDRHVLQNLAVLRQLQPHDQVQ